MNIIFSNNSNNNADGCFKLHRYTEVCFFICTAMGNYPLISGIAIRVSVSFSNFAWVLILNLRSFLEDFVFSTTYLTDVPQYDTCMWKDI